MTYTAKIHTFHCSYSEVLSFELHRESNIQQCRVYIWSPNKCIRFYTQNVMQPVNRHLAVTVVIYHTTQLYNLFIWLESSKRCHNQKTARQFHRQSCIAAFSQSQLYFYDLIMLMSLEQFNNYYSIGSNTLIRETTLSWTQQLEQYIPTAQLHTSYTF